MVSVSEKDFSIAPDGTIIRNGAVPKKTNQDMLMDEFSKLEYEVVHSVRHRTTNKEKIARYYELKKILEIPAETDVLKFAKQKEANDKR